MLYQLSHFRPHAPLSRVGLAGAEGQNRTDDTRLFRAVLYRLSYLGATTLAKDTDSPLPSQPDQPMSAACVAPLASRSRTAIRSAIGGWVSHIELARCSKLLIGLTM